MTRLQVTCAVAAGNVLGEGLIWSASHHALYWTDIAAATLWRHDPKTHATRIWRLPERLSCFAFCMDEEWLLMGLASRLAFFHLGSATLHPLMAVEPNLPTRINDGACDHEGRFVFGMMHEPMDGARQRAIGGFYRLNPDLTLERLSLPPAAIPNSIAFDPNGRRLYFCDSLKKRIECCAYAADGHISDIRTFVDLPSLDGVPDGSTCDAQGGLWNAQWGTGRVVRYDGQGREDRAVAVPTRQPTRPAFGGADLQTLYVTTAREGLLPDQLESDSQAGHVFAIPNDRKWFTDAVFRRAGATHSLNAYTAWNPEPCRCL